MVWGNRPFRSLDNRGTSLVEALISVGIMSFVIVSILSGFSQQQMSTRNSTSRNAAVQMAEIRMEEMLKFATTQMIAENFNDFIVFQDEGFEVFTADPNKQKQFRRETKITMDLLGQVATIEVTVRYPLTGTIYPFSVTMVTRRGVK
jgi:Tfp pilus assembly protein PilV